jgi:hypothetical protein
VPFARYTSATGYKTCSPVNLEKTAFPVAPGGIMPAIEGCKKLDYAGLFVIAVALAADDGDAGILRGNSL